MIEVLIDTYDSAQLVAHLESCVEDMGNFCFSGTFSAEYHHSRTIRDTISAILQKNKVEPPWNRRFALISDELVNNAIEHGSQSGDQNSFMFCIDSSGSPSVTMTVSDAGNGLSRKTAADMETLREKKREERLSGYTNQRGRGLFHIIETLVDALEFHDNERGGLDVTVRKTFC